MNNENQDPNPKKEDGLKKEKVANVSVEEGGTPVKKQSTMRKDEKKHIVKKKKSKWAWPIKILIITLVLSLLFTVFSEMALSKTGMVVSIVILIPLLAIAVISDMVGVAVACCTLEDFTAMASRKVRGARESITLIKNAEKVSSICNDVIGDVCGIISGAIGVNVVAKIMMSMSSITSSQQIFLAAGVSAVIAGLTVFGKAVAKNYAVNQSTRIVSGVGKFISIFNRKIK